MKETEEQEAIRHNQMADAIVAQAQALGVDPLMLAVRIIDNLANAASSGMDRGGGNKRS